MSDIIQVICGELTTSFDNEVMKAVQQVGINVNKEELLKALELADKLVYCKECVYCEQDLIVERTSDGHERWINLCHVSKPPKVVELHHYCGYGERIEE